VAKLSNIIPEYMNPTASGSRDDIWLLYRALATTNSCFRSDVEETLMTAEKKATKVLRGARNTQNCS